MQLYRSLKQEENESEKVSSASKLKKNLAKASMKAKLKKKKELPKISQEAKITETEANPYFKGTDTIEPSFKGTKEMETSSGKSASSVMELQKKLEANKKKKK